jgi:hypothetical protein
MSLRHYERYLARTTQTTASAKATKHGDSVQIECRTTSAASHVVQTLMLVGLRPGQGFSILNPYESDLPIRFTVHVALASPIVSQLQDIADTSVTEAA